MSLPSLVHAQSVPASAARAAIVIGIGVTVVMSSTRVHGFAGGASRTNTFGVTGAATVPLAATIRVVSANVAASGATAEAKLESPVESARPLTIATKPAVAAFWTSAT